jgi:hypothetical protein
MSVSDATVFVPGLGFRPSRGLRLAEPVTVWKDEQHALRVMSMLSTEKGTELTFELRDPEREAECSVAVTDPRWSAGTVRLRGIDDPAIADLPPGRGLRFSFGQHAFGSFRRELAFEALPPNTRNVSVELRGGLGEWDVPLELHQIEESGVLPVTDVGVGQERHGIAVRIRGVAVTDTATHLDVEGVAASPTRLVVGIGAWIVRHDDERLVLIDERGNRFDEVADASLPRADPGQGGRTIATFPPIPADSKELTLLVQKVLVRESGARLEIALPVHAPMELTFGSDPVTIRWAEIVDDLRPAPGEPPTRGIEVQFKSRESHDGRRVLWPIRLLVDGEPTWNYGFNHADPEALRLNVPLRAGESAKSVTFLDPVVEVRGPWEIQWRKS